MATNNDSPNILSKMMNNAKLRIHQRQNRTTLPCPPSPSTSLKSRQAISRATRSAKVSSLHDFNRQLPPSPQPTLTQPNNNLAPDIDSLTSAIASCISELDTCKAKFNAELATIKETFKNEQDPTVAVNGLLALLESSNALFACHEKTLSFSTCALAILKDQDALNSVRDSRISANSNDIQSLNTRLSCDEDLCKVFIFLTCPNEASSLLKNPNIIGESLKILQRLEIDTFKLGLLPIKRAYIHHTRVDGKLEPSLCIQFQNQNIAVAVRRQIDIFNNSLVNSDRLNELRYTHFRFWSPHTFKLLRVCLELKRVNLIKSLRVTTSGILVHYTQGNADSEAPLKSHIVSCYNDLNSLRVAVNDIHPNTNCELLYDQQYFSQTFTARDTLRDGQSQLASQTAIIQSRGDLN